MGKYRYSSQLGSAATVLSSEQSLSIVTSTMRKGKGRYLTNLVFSSVYMRVSDWETMLVVRETRDCSSDPSTAEILHPTRTTDPLTSLSSAGRQSAL